ncbi:hypothetical protein RF11_05168 [Thelohanellus kitauei]|uniref:Uncharacterized protein n=1 Tax=Thelohanellus kitauei TaxID=669202 RepID=A0A0C2N8M4_THEKT|nr:hypothetical protein RF11_05168 [Thelohanellus kitauei]
MDIHPSSIAELINCIQVQFIEEGKLYSGTLMSLFTSVPRRNYFDCRPDNGPNIPTVHIKFPPEIDIKKKNKPNARKTKRGRKRFIPKRRRNGVTNKGKRTAKSTKVSRSGNNQPVELGQETLIREVQRQEKVLPTVYITNIEVDQCPRDEPMNM